MIGFPGEEEFRGRGVVYCVTCDGELFTGKDVFVIGGGYAAAEETVLLTRYAKHVHSMFRKGDFSCAPVASEAASTATQMERYIAKMQKKIGIVPKPLRNSENELDPFQTKDSVSDSTDENQASNASELSSDSSNTIFDEDLISQLSFVFARMENPLILKLYLNNETVSEELKYYCNELVKLTDKISVEEAISGNDEFNNLLDETSQASKDFVSMTR